MTSVRMAMVLASVLALAPGAGEAKGCLKGAAVGGVAGHLIGKHAVAGAAVGCAVGHHEAKVKERRDAQSPAPVDNPPAPAAEPNQGKRKTGAAV